MEAGPRRRRLAGAGERLAGRWRRRQRAKLLLLLGVGALAAGGFVALYYTDSLRRLDLDTMDARFSIRGKEKPRHDIVVVAISDETIQDMPKRLRYFDWLRTRHARVIRNLKKAGAKVIVYDIEFSEASRSDEADFALYEEAGKARPVVFSTTQVLVNGDTLVFGGRENLRPIGASVGHGNFPPDPSQVIRRVAYQLDGLKSLGIVGAETVLGRKIPPPHGNRSANEWIDYAGPPGTYPEFNFADVFFNRFPPGTFRGKTVVVGVTSTTTLQDVHATPMGGGNMTGPEIQANVIATALDGFPLRNARTLWNLIAIIGLGLVGPLASLALRQSLAPILVVLAAAGYLVLAQLQFDDGTVLSVAYPMLALVVGEVGSLGVVYFTETRERRRLKTIFARFVPEAVVDQVVDQAEGDLRLGARRLESTVLFCDLRGFTSFAESLGEEIIDVLNHYLTEMSSAILDHGGTLVAYMGDGIMAVFGAPLEQPDHADRAVSAAKEMLGVRLPAFNTWLAENGMPSGFRMGIGLNTGQVMSGNVGSERRMEYTAVGDTTNTASRIEGMTKGTPHQLFISDATRSLLETETEGLIEYGDVPVRGRQETIKLWALVEDEPDGDGGGDGDAAPAAAAGAPAPSGPASDTPD
jgi:adenylate cyclase